MTANVQDQRTMLLQTDDEFRSSPPSTRNSKIALQNSPTSPTSPNPNNSKQATIKKRKLQLKDRMEDIVRRSPAPSGAQALSA